MSVLGDGVIGKPVSSGAATKTFTSGDAKSAPFLNAAYTSPRAIWASCSDYNVADAGDSQATSQFFATRLRVRLAGGRWKAIAPVFVGAYTSTNHAPTGTANTAPYTFSWSIELSNGSTPTNNYDYLNTGGAKYQGKVNGNIDGICRPNDIVVGDFLYATDLGLSDFSFSDRSKGFWVNVAYSKTASTDNIGAVAQTEYNAPMNAWEAACTSYANAKGLILAANTAFATGANHWGTGDSSTLPGPIGWIGIPLDGQKAVFFMGTSIFDGDGNMGNYKNGGVNPANNAMQNYDLLGWPCAWAQDLSRQAPCLNFGVGGSAMGSLWSDTASDYSWSTDVSVTAQRLTLAKLASWFDVVVANDVHNDSGIAAAYSDVLKVWTNNIREANPNIIIVGCRVPNGYVDITGSTVAYNAAGLDPRWTAQDAMVTAGYWNGMLTLRQGGNIWPDLGVQVTSTTTSDGSVTTLNDSGATWLPNQWTNSWVSVGGVQKLISVNSRTQLTFAAMAGAVLTGTAYQILGNTTADGIHPNSLGQKSMLAPNFATQIAPFIAIRYFTRTA